MKTSFLNPGSIKDQVTLSELIACLGYKPTKSNGDEQLYLNVLRNDEAKPTFLINTQLDVWYDRLTKKSGNIIDFGLAYWPELNSYQITEKINQLFTTYSELSVKANSKPVGRKRRAIKIPFYHIQETKPVGCNTEITEYLKSEGLWEMAIGHLKEVYYYVVDEKYRRKDFFAAGWQNENGGWEVMSKNFSGSLGRKGMTFIPGKENSLALFDDYLNYLSWKYTNKLPGPSILILNSPEFSIAAKKRAEKFKNVVLIMNESFKVNNP